MSYCTALHCATQYGGHLLTPSHTHSLTHRTSHITTYTTHHSGTYMSYCTISLTNGNYLHSSLTTSLTPSLPHSLALNDPLALHSSQTYSLTHFSTYQSRPVFPLRPRNPPAARRLAATNSTRTEKERQHVTAVSSCFFILF